MLKWQSVYARFAKWRDDGTLEAVFRALSADADMKNLSLDSTCVKVHESANGRTRGGLNTKLHDIVDGLGNPVEFMLSAGNDHDSVHAVELLEKVGIGGSNVLADRASDPWPADWCMYKERHLVECLFQKLKWFRRIAKRYDKLDASFLAFVYLASFSAICSPPASPTGVN